MKVTSRDFKENAARALADSHLQTAQKRATSTLAGKRRNAVENLPDFEELRTYCGNVKGHTLEHLDHYLEQLIDRFEENGGHVHFAADAAEANEIAVSIAQERGVRTVVKSKSMLSEEIGLNEALEQAGIEPFETDLGEYILQLDDDVPSHLIAPVVHKTREQITALFHDRLGVRADATIEELTKAAREELRGRFLQAEMGITGANFAVADSGSIVLVENEGNIRLSSAAPPIHLTVMGLEKLIPRMEDLPAFLEVLPRSATGQKASAYVSVLTGPRRSHEQDGPEEMHLLLVDNGRSKVLADPKMRAALRCIRCGACLNSCPVYQQVGGHSYGWVYPGPIGAVLDPGLLGLEETQQLPQASSLCGACGDVCPVKIPLPEMLIEHRRRSVEQGLTGSAEGMSVGAFAFAAKQPAVWDAATKAGRFGASLFDLDGYLQGGWLPVLKEWLRERDFPAPARKSFKQMWRSELSKPNPEPKSKTEEGSGE